VQPPASLQGAVDLGITVYPKYRLAVLAFGIVIIMALYFFLNKTNLGAILRAGIENREMVMVLGVDINKVFLATFCLGTYLAGLAGGLATPIMGLTPSLGLDILPLCFVVVVVAGLGSIPGAILAGILIGLSQGIATIWWPEATNVAVYVMMGLTIILRPQGLFGTR